MPDGPAPDDALVAASIEDAVPGALHGWRGDEFPIRLWPSGAEAKYFRLFGEGWEVAMWDVALPDWPAWSEALRGTPEFPISGGCRVAWLGDGVTFCDPPALFSSDCMSGGVLAALPSAGEFICPVDPDEPLAQLSDERMSWLRHYAKGLADVE